MSSQLLTLTLPSAIVLALLVVHSYRALSRARASLFWGAVVVFGVVRAHGVEFVTSSLGASFPYVFHQARVTIAGVPIQEIGGWAIVAYLGWWLGVRLTTTTRGGSQNPYFVALWAALFLALICLVVETAAIAAKWWHWTIPARSQVFGQVPAIGLVDWGFVAFDFLLPFLLLTRERSWRTMLSLALFPLHFGSHLLLEPIGLPHSIPPIHLVHWFVPIGVLWLGSRSKADDEAFQRGSDLLPLLAVSVVLADVALVLTFLVGKPQLLVALAPVVTFILFSVRPKSGWIAAGAGTLISFVSPTSLLTVVPPVAGTLLRESRRHQWLAPALCLAAGAGAIAFHASASFRRAELIGTLERAVAARNQGRIADAVYLLEGLRTERPTEHAPRALLGEIYYQTGRLPEALVEYEAVARIKADHLPAYRYQAAILMQQGDASAAKLAVAEGLAIRPDDLELRYLERRLQMRSALALAEEATTVDEMERLAALAFEVNDVADAARFLERGIERWPSTRKFYQLRARIAVVQKDYAALRRLSAEWLERMPEDAEAKRLAEQVGTQG